MIKKRLYSLKFTLLSFCNLMLPTYSTVDFGSESNPEECFEVQELFEPHGPKVNSEYYPGWLDHWGQPHNTVSTSKVAKILDKMLSLGKQSLL